VLSGCQSSASRFTDQDASAVRGLFDSVVTDIRAANADAWVAHFADDARFHRSNGPALVGRAAILAWGKGFPPVKTFTFGPAEVSGEGNLAYGWSSVVSQFGDFPVDTAKQLVVFRRGADGRWRVEAVSVSSDLPLPQPSATRRK